MSSFLKIKLLAHVCRTSQKENSPMMIRGQKKLERDPQPPPLPSPLFSSPECLFS